MVVVSVVVSGVRRQRIVSRRPDVDLAAAAAAGADHRRRRSWHDADRIVGCNFAAVLRFVATAQTEAVMSLRCR